MNNYWNYSSTTSAIKMKYAVKAKFFAAYEKRLNHPWDIPKSLDAESRIRWIHIHTPFTKI